MSPRTVMFFAKFQCASGSEGSESDVIRLGRNICSNGVSADILGLSSRSLIKLLQPQGRSSESDVIKLGRNICSNGVSADILGLSSRSLIKLLQPQGQKEAVSSVVKRKMRTTSSATSPSLRVYLRYNHHLVFPSRFGVFNTRQ
ncbi:hypothetical protein J6590_036054 [Homalodisca vitripennis]|nr:hypothetical protein J6590_036054 [Homalodisca vitripennis]